MYMFFVVFLKMNCPEKNILYLKKTHCKNADLFHLQKHQSPHRSDNRLSDSNILMKYFLFFGHQVYFLKTSPT